MAKDDLGGPVQDGGDDFLSQHTRYDLFSDPVEERTSKYHDTVLKAVGFHIGSGGTADELKEVLEMCGFAVPEETPMARRHSDRPAGPRQH